MNNIQNPQLISLKSKYLNFKKSLLYELVEKDGLDLLRSTIFSDFQALVWGKPFLKNIATNEDKNQEQIMKYKQIWLDNSTKLNILQFQCRSDKKYKRKFHSVQDYEQQIQKLQSQIVRLKNQNLQEFTYFQNVILQFNESNNLIDSFSCPGSVKNDEIQHYQQQYREISQNQIILFKQNRKSNQIIQPYQKISIGPLATYKNNNYQIQKQSCQEFQDKYNFPFLKKQLITQEQFNDISSINEQKQENLDGQTYPVDKLEQLFNDLYASHKNHFEKYKCKHIFKDIQNQVKQFIELQNQKLINLFNNHKQKNTQFQHFESLDQTQIQKNIQSSKRLYSDKQKEIGKRELILIIHQKRLAEKKVQLQRMQQELLQKEEFLKKQLEKKIKQLEQKRFRLSEREKEIQKNQKNLRYRLQQITQQYNNMSFKESQNDGKMNKQHIQLLWDKVKFQGKKRFQLFAIDRQNLVIQNLKQLYERMQTDKAIQLKGQRFQ